MTNNKSLFQGMGMDISNIIIF